MPTKTKLLIVLLLLTLAGTGRASFYIDLHLSHLSVQDTPEIGDIGHTLAEDLPETGFSLALGTTLTPRVNAEFRYTHLGDLNITKVSPIWTIFPPQGEVVLPAERYYRLNQSSQLFSFALPIKLVEKGRCSLALTPLLHLEHTEIAVHDLYVNANVVTGFAPVPAYESNRTKLHFGTELNFGYRPTPKLKLSLLYSYSLLETYDAHLFGTGLELEF